MVLQICKSKSSCLYSRNLFCFAL